MTPERSTVHLAGIALAAVALAALLAGCTISPVETASTALDTAEHEVRAARVAYQERFNGITRVWLCDGMSMTDMVRLFGTATKAIEFLNSACGNTPLPTGPLPLPALVQ